MKYNIKTKAEKEAAVKLVLEEGKSIRQVAEELGLASNSLRGWVDKEKRITDPEYAKLKEERDRKKSKKTNDPFPEGVLMAAKTNPEELARENRDLRRKVAYLEDKTAYLETLYKLISVSPDQVDKKKESRQSRNLLREEEKT